MTENRWIIVRNWGKFQHYHDRRPVWIKVYTELESSDAFRALSYAERGLLLHLWITYSNSRGVLSVASVGQRSGQKTRTQHLEALADAGWIDIVASKPKEIGAMPEKKLREEKKELKAPPRQTPKPNPNGKEEERPLIPVVDACQMFIEGRAWDDTYDDQAMTEEFQRIERGRRTEGELGNNLPGLLEQWKATRQDRYGIKANL